MAPSSDPASQFAVDEGGAVRLVGELDRETADSHTVLVLAVDDGAPPRTATATLAVSTCAVWRGKEKEGRVEGCMEGER